MSRKCDMCGKGPGKGNQVSHSNKRNPRKFYPNLHTITVEENRTKIKKKVCSRCLKTLSKAK